ncbi:MAG: sigma-70 family RNA polymerase sigma factor [Ignavibacteria bacterium]|nr:sigma-70 family RNA polymerase sigma factor [Ignavibacteria bacterium]
MIKIDNERVLFLLGKIKERDEEAFKEFFFIFQPSIFYYLFKFVYNRATAEDLTQETFIKFWLSSDRLDLTLSGKAYLYKIAHNLAINHTKRKPRDLAYESEELDVHQHAGKTSMDYVFLLDDYQKAVNSLPERCRAVFTLCRNDGFEYSEIAEILDLSLQTVKNQMSKALAVLRKRLQAHLN